MTKPELNTQINEPNYKELAYHVKIVAGRGFRGRILRLIEMTVHKAMIMTGHGQTSGFFHTKIHDILQKHRDYIKETTDNFPHNQNGGLSFEKAEKDLSGREFRKFEQIVLDYKKQAEEMDIIIPDNPVGRISKLWEELSGKKLLDPE